MSPMSQRLQELQNRDRELKSRLGQLGEMRPGSLVECYRKCGSPGAGARGLTTEDTDPFGW
jgi:hypothetical protein